MLGKLIKHEFKSTVRILLPLYVILFVLSIVDRIILNLDIFDGALAIIPGFITVAYIFSIVAVAVVTFVLMVFRFYKNLMSDEGYLMFTLPVGPGHLVNSKLIVAFLWTILSIVGILLSLFIVFADKIAMQEFSYYFDLAMKELRMSFGNHNTTLLIIELIAMILFSIINNILKIYVSIAIGQLFNGHKVIGSIGAYIAISIVVQILTIIFLFIGGHLVGKTITELEAIPQLVFPVSITLTLIYNAAFYLVTRYIFKRNLNLE